MTAKFSSLLPTWAARVDIADLLQSLRRAVPDTQTPGQAVRALNWAIADRLGRRRLP
jgi:hypothetical protein